MPDSGNQYGIWAAITGIFTILTGGHLMIVKNTTVSQAEFKTEREKCQGSIQTKLESIETHQKRQGNLLVVIAKELKIKDDDVVDL